MFKLSKPSLFSAKARTSLGTGKAPDAAAVKLTTEVNGVLAIPVLLMKCVFLWPDSQNAVTRFIANRVYPFCIILLIMGGMAFIVEGKYDSGVTALTAFGDAMASSMCLLKLLLLSREGPQVHAHVQRQMRNAAWDWGVGSPSRWVCVQVRSQRLPSMDITEYPSKAKTLYFTSPYVKPI